MSLKVEVVQRLDLGLQGEHNARTIRIDCSNWMQQFPNGTVSLHHMRHCDDTLDVTGASFDRDTAILSWTITEYDSYEAGDGMAEIRLTDGGLVKKKKKAITLVRPCVVNENEQTVSSNWQAFLDEVERLKNLMGSEAEAWAVGERGGVPVSSDDDTYHNNSKYYHDNMATVAQYYIDEIEAAGAAAEQLIPGDLTFYASVTSVTGRLADFGYAVPDALGSDWHTLVLEEDPDGQYTPQEEENNG